MLTDTINSRLCIRKYPKSMKDILFEKNKLMVDDKLILQF